MLSDRLTLRTHIRSLGRKPTTAEKVELSKRRGKLKLRVAEHQKKARTFLKITAEEENQDDFDFQEEEILIDEDDHPSEIVDLFYESPEIERYRISLPSTITEQIRQARKLRKAVHAEVQLRLGQCNDALQAIRMAIGKKAFIYVSDVRRANNTKGKTRSYDGIKAAHKTLQHQAQVYRSARQALVDLGADEEILAKYQLLLPNQLNAKQTFLDVQQGGQKHSNLPWFWSLDVEGDSADNARMEECKVFRFVQQLNLIGR